MNKNLKIIYMGTPEFAVAPLKALIENAFNIVAVVTAPDKPAGRGQPLKKSEVKIYAENNNLKILQPTNLKDPVFVETLRSFNADLFIVVAFRMLPEIVWKIPKLGTFNIHASLLPNYRGAAPINHAIINGEKITGLTSFLINEEIDTGNIILQEACEITDDDNFGSLHDKLMEMSKNFVIKSIEKLTSRDFIPIPQSEITINSELKSAPKINKDFCKINFYKSCIYIHNLVRGLSPYPCAYSILNNETLLKIYKTKPIISQNINNFKPGTIITDNKNFLRVAASDGFIEIIDLQIAGRKRMLIKDFLNGFNFKENSFLN